jgi:two-component system, cell cycle sensor histidine kinase PleC
MGGGLRHLLMDWSRANLETNRSARIGDRLMREPAFRPPMDDTVGPAGAPNFRLRPVWLRFNDPSVEREFQDEHLTRALPAIRLFLTTACLLYAVFGLLDHYVVNDIEGIAWTIRYAVVCPLFVTTVLLTFTSLFGRVAQFMLSLNMVASGMGVIIMTALARPPGNSLYYAGLIMVVIYGSTLVRLRTQYAALISVFLVGLYDFAALAINPISVVAFINNEFFLVMSVGMGVFGSYAQELHIRRDYTSSRMLRSEKLRSDRLLVEAQAASTAKGEFLSTMSHELRTPLNAILGFSDVMQRRMFGPIGSEKYAEYAKDIHNAADHLLSIITDILDLSKADVGKLVLNEEEVDLCESIDQACRLLREKAAEAGLRLSFEPPAAQVTLWADARLVKQVVLNLLSNAIKFTQTGGAVAVVLDCAEAAGCALRVKDTGIGIAEANLGKVLEPFVQVESALTRKHGGTGLGLPLAKKIMELHGGSLDIASALGVGTEVTIRFPANRIGWKTPAPLSSVA